VFAAHRGRGYATRAVQLLLHGMAQGSRYHTATLLIDRDNHRSLALAARTRFTRAGDLDGHPYFKRIVPPLSYADGVVTIRRPEPADLDAHLASIDDAQKRWMWRPGERQRWEQMTAPERRTHVRAWLVANRHAFGRGPKWSFAVDAPGHRHVAYIDCDLASENVPYGEANVSYSAHPAHRGKGHVSRALRLVLQFLTDHTGARELHCIVEQGNDASGRVVASIGAAEQARWIDAHGRAYVRYVRHMT
jgi:RimJ/RimL family protein N-acetyltransferase